jgi:hypothetical protein
MTKARSPRTIAADDEGTVATDDDTATINVDDATPLITIVKDVDANGDGVFNDSEGMVEGTHDVTYQFTITADASNASTDPVTITAVSDDRFGNLLAEAEADWAAQGNTGPIVLDPGESFTFDYTTSLTLVDGGPDDPHINVVTVTGEDDEGTQATDMDDATINVVRPGVVTSSQFCDFDVDPLTPGDQFNLIFTPDVQNWPGAYKLSDSNPGQFFYNLFFTPEDVGNGDGLFDAGETLTISIPYPFVTQGGNPVHAYSSFDVDENGCFIFDPADEIFSGQEFGQDLIFTLGAYTDTNGDGIIGVGDTYELTVNVDQLQDGFVALNIHLDYDLEGTKGWLRSGEDVLNDPDVITTVDGQEVLGDILNLADYTFSASTTDSSGVEADLAGSTDTVQNSNEFKNIKGIGGLVLDQNDDGIVGAQVQVVETANPNVVLETMTTDENGWYLSEYVHKGKATSYTVKLLDQDGSTVLDETLVNVDTDDPGIVGRNIKFGEGNFSVVVDEMTGVWSVPLPLQVAEGANSGDQSGADLSQAMLAPVVAAAVDYWAEQGVDTEALDTLLSTDIRIEDLGGSQLGETDGVTVTLDDDAAGYGWSESVDSVDANEVDLLSALTHEFGHVLGYGHDTMDETLAVGERDLPLDDTHEQDDEFTLNTGIEDDLLFG